VGPCPPPDGGTTIPFQLLTEYLRDRTRGNVEVINTHKGGVRVYRGPRSIFSAVWQLARILITAAIAARRAEVCIVNGSSRFIRTAAVPLLPLLRIVSRCRIYVYIAGGDWDIVWNGLSATYRSVVKRSLQMADRIIVQAQCTADGLNGAFSNVSVIPNWACRLTGGLNDVEHGDATERDVRFLFVGEVRREKGIHELLSAVVNAQRSLQGQPPVSLDIIGPIKDDCGPILETSVRESGGSIRHHGHMTHGHLLKRMAACDVVVLPTFHSGEGYPGVLLEAMLLGKPVITTRARTILEIIHDGENGLLVEARDALALSRAMIRMAESRGLRLQLASGARQTGGRFDWQTVLGNLCELCGV
jgi:glycosyltransferase involved in cell wall biosynthesis